METDPDIAFGGGNYLVVWSDCRLDINRIYASRVSPSGVVLDPAGVQIGPSVDTTRQNAPALVFTGSRFAVVWLYGGLNKAITGRFIGTNGQPIDTFRVCALSQDAMASRIAYDGTNFLVSWVEATSPFTVNGQLVSGTGVPIGSPFLIATTTSGKGVFGLCYDGTNYCVTWSDTVIRGRKYARNGTPVGPSFKVSSALYSQGNPFVVAGASNRYLNVWTETHTPTLNDICGNVDVAIDAIAEQRSSTTARARLPSVRHGSLDLYRNKGYRIYDTQGRLVESRGKTSPGVYFLKSEAEPTESTKKVVVLE